MPRDGRRHAADRPGAGDEHVLADEVEAERGVGGVAEGVEEGGDVVGDVGRQLEGVGGRDAQVLGEAARPVDADTDGVATQMPLAGAAVAAMTAGDVALAGDAIALLETGHVAADLDDLADELVTDRHRHGDGALRPFVPVVDVHVGAADGGLADADEHVVRADIGLVLALHPDARFAFRLHQRLHAMTPMARPTRVKASTARSMCSGSWAADICVRMRASPFGTTG